MTQPQQRLGAQIATDGQDWFIAGHHCWQDAYSGQPLTWVKVPRWRLIRRWQCWHDRRWATRLTRMTGIEPACAAWEAIFRPLKTL